MQTVFIVKHANTHAYDFHSQVAVLGGNNELGSYLCPRLSADGHDVVSVHEDQDIPFLANGLDWNKIEVVLLDRATLDNEASGLFGVSAWQQDLHTSAVCERPTRNMRNFFTSSSERDCMRIR